MELRLDYDRPEEGPGSGPLTVGWFLAQDKGAVLYDPPERVSIQATVNQLDAWAFERATLMVEAVSGAKIKVPTVDGPVMLTVQPGTSSGKTMRLAGKGFGKKDGKRGDQLVTLEIDLPEDVTELAKRLEGWQDTRNPRAKLGV